MSEVANLLWLDQFCCALLNTIWPGVWKYSPEEEVERVGGSTHTSASRVSTTKQIRCEHDDGQDGEPGDDDDDVGDSDDGDGRWRSLTSNLLQLICNCQTFKVWT